MQWGLSSEITPGGACLLSDLPEKGSEGEKGRSEWGRKVDRRGVSERQEGKYADIQALRHTYVDLGRQTFILTCTHM